MTATTVTLTIPDLDEHVDTLSAALAYIAAGWYVLPVKRGTKNPGSVVGKRWQTLSSRDPQQIVAWFAGTDYDIALHCGRSGATVLDVDHPERLPEVVRKHLDSAPFQNTRPDEPDRGHVVFATPPGRTLGNGTGRLPKGWGEIRGANGVIVVMPSTHKNGGRYRWDSTGAAPVLPNEIAELLDDAPEAAGAASDVVVQAFLDEHTKATRPDVLAGLVKALGNHFASGASRHTSTLTVLTGALKEARAGFYPAQGAVDTFRPMFLDAVAKEPVSDDQGEPRTGKVAADEFDGILAWSVGQAVVADLDKVRERTDEQIPGNVTEVSLEDFVNPNGDKAKTSLLDQRGVTGAWLDGQQFPPLEYAVYQLVPEGLGVLAGPPKKGKSFLVADIALAVASGGKALGVLATTQRPVLILALEDGHRRLKSRFRRILPGQHLPAGITVVTVASSDESLELIEEFFTRHAAEKPLVIVDTLGKVRPPKKPSEDAYQADYKVGSTLKSLVDAVPGATLLVVHHTRKAEADDFVDSVSGTQGIAGSVDFVFVLVRARHSNEALLSVTGRDIKEGEYALLAEEGMLWRLDGTTLDEAAKQAARRQERGHLGERQRSLLLFVCSRPETTLEDAADHLSCGPKHAGDALRELHDANRIVRLRRGVYGPIPASPF